VLARPGAIRGRGTPRRAEAAQRPDFIIVGYGKVGGLELGPGSTWIWFIHGGDPVPRPMAPSHRWRAVLRRLASASFIC
jgi:hypothetical protein